VSGGLAPSGGSTCCKDTGLGDEHAFTGLCAWSLVDSKRTSGLLGRAETDEAQKFEPQLCGRPVVNIVVSTRRHVELLPGLLRAPMGRSTRNAIFRHGAVCGGALNTGVVGDCDVHGAGVWTSK